MLPNHSPLVIAEQFGTLESLYPGRIDLGLGRAPGSDQATAHALRRNLVSDADEFPQDVMELIDYFSPQPRNSIRAVPGTGLNVPIWILGSSLFGAQLAAALGLPYAFASHFAPDQLLQAIAMYRSRFRPSERLAAPYVMLGFNVIAAETDAAARLLATSMQQSFVSLRSGHPVPLPPPREGYLESLGSHERAMLNQVLECSAIGSPETVSRELQKFVARTSADELMINSNVFEHAERLRSYEIVNAIAAQIRQAHELSATA